MRNDILALIPNWLGDAAMCTPALRALRRRFPEARLIALGRPGPCALLRGLSHLDAVMDWEEAAARRAELKGAEAAVVFPHSFRAAWQAWRLRPRRIVGQARNGRAWLLTDAVAPRRENGRIIPLYMAQEYLELAAAFGCEDDGLGLELVADETLVQRMRARLTGDGPLIGIAPGAAFGPSKCWPAERYAAVSDALAAQCGARLTLFTGPGEEKTRRAVLAAAKTTFLKLDDGPPRIEALKAGISLLDLFIGNDSGARHIAVAFHVPTVCIMGPTAPAYSCGPYERGHVLRVDVDCGPCQKPACHTDHRCMTRISVEWAVNAAKELLAGGP